ncbi:hypothetical protein [Pseudomonas syringae]|uniref:hypothetical protein n=2 Tax=Pseudomonas syringae TaxID=317 RepID=UPI0004142FA7|nr:hypothetical protein [Pseudomonas syringae]PBP57532.1 hypothetical protein CCL10_05085 [Pseudomonas syringae]
MIAIFLFYMLEAYAASPQIGVHMLFKALLELVFSLRNTSIEVHEWNQSDVRRPRLANGSTLGMVSTKHRDLSFSGCQLAHAVVKADYLDTRNLTMPGIGFLFQASGIIDFDSCPLELKRGAGQALNDFSLTGMTGRVGQGLAILYAHRMDLRFAAHLKSYVCSLPAGSVGAAHKNESMADFLFSNAHETVLIEAKGSFTLRENAPSEIKKVLKKALEKQVDPWMRYLRPAPSNGYVIYSCLRDGVSEPSAMFVVDPEGENTELSDLPMGVEQVMRENYAAWLRAMGLVESAERLLRPEVSQPVEYSFLIARVGNREFAFLDRYLGIGSYQGWWIEPCLGLDVEVLLAISSVVRSSQESLQDLLANFPDPSEASPAYVSIFPDGSIFGLVVCDELHPVRILL